MDLVGFQVYARICGWTLARAHARSGPPKALASYLGSGASFDKAMLEFAGSYADQNTPTTGPCWLRSTTVVCSAPTSKAIGADRPVTSPSAAGLPSLGLGRLNSCTGPPWTAAGQDDAGSS